MFPPFPVLQSRARLGAVVCDLPCAVAGLSCPTTARHSRIRYGRLHPYRPRGHVRAAKDNHGQSNRCSKHPAAALRPAQCRIGRQRSTSPAGTTAYRRLHLLRLPSAPLRLAPTVPPPTSLVRLSLFLIYPRSVFVLIAMASPLGGFSRRASGRLCA